MPGFYSWRRGDKHGSYFIQALCKELEEKAFLFDIDTILKFVHHRVAVDYVASSEEESLNETKQQPVYFSSLNKVLKFTQRVSTVLAKVVLNSL